MGAPSVSGGMTASEQRALLREEREYNERMEEERRARALADEAAREEREFARQAAIKAEEAARLAEAQVAEQSVIDEATLQEEEEKKSGKIKVDFFTALGKGMTNETRSQ